VRNVLEGGGSRSEGPHVNPEKPEDDEARGALDCDDSDAWPTVRRRITSSVIQPSGRSGRLFSMLMNILSYIRNT